jgi:transcriptional regulator with XRE-family HTH domain
MATLKVTDRVGELGNLAGDLGSYLKEQRENARLSLRQLASATGISNPYLSQIERGLRKPSAEVLQQIAKGLQISAEALFLRAGILEESPGLQVEVAIQSDVYLTARQKRVLLDIYTTFRAENLRGTANGAAADADDAEDAEDAEDTDVADVVAEPVVDEQAEGDDGTDDEQTAEPAGGTTARKPRKKSASRAAVRKAVNKRTVKKTASAQGSEAASTTASASTSDSTTESTATPRRTRGGRRRSTQGDDNG